MDHFGAVVGALTKQELLRRENRNPEGGGDAPPPLSSPSRDEFHILEVAAGTGRFTRHVFDQTMRGGSAASARVRLTATDMSAAAIERARRVLPRDMTEGDGDDDDGRVSLLGDVDMADMPFVPDGSVDVVVCGFGLMFPPNKGRVAREFRRVLRPGGKVYATMFCTNGWFEAAQGECVAQFGARSPILRGALALGDPTPVATAFREASMDPQLMLVDYGFEADVLDTEELLYNAAILLDC